MKQLLCVAAVAAVLANAPPVRAQAPASTAPPPASMAPPSASSFPSTRRSPLHHTHLAHHTAHHHALHHGSAPRVSEADQLNRQELAHLDVGGTPLLRMPAGGKVISK